MKELEKEKLYCSLDVETSGFDPLTNEILEVGFAFFKINNKGIEITEEWTQVFKPSKPASPQILGLTGISQKELDEAPSFGEHREFLQEKLGQAVIVGHNVIFDIKFLEAFGVKLKGQVVDTLDLVQFILPTHHSYNLENLMHTFDLKHKEAHRALADSKATLQLLEKMLQVYSGFPKVLKAKIEKLVSPYNFAWESFLQFNLPALDVKDFFINKKTKILKIYPARVKLAKETVYNFNLGEDLAPALVSGVPKEKILLVVPKAQAVLDLYRQGLVEEAIFLPEVQFDEKKLNQLMGKKDLSPEQCRFLVKILVWQYTNWQSQTLLDLNLSFFGGQFKSLVSGGEIKINKSAKVVATDLPTFLHLSENQLYQDRQVIVCGLNEFEAAATNNIGAKTSWGYIGYLLRSYYNPELNTGQVEYKAAVEEALSSGDLFFGLVNALFQTDPPSFQYVKISDGMEYNEKYLKVKSASENYIGKIKKANEVLAAKEIEKFSENLGNFFTSEENRVKWIELSPTACAFLSMPLDITALVKNILKPFVFVSFADSLDHKILPKFFLKRLGLENFSVKDGSVRLGRSEKVEHGNKQARSQGDLFSGLKKVFSKQSPVINYYCLEQAASTKEIMDIVSSEKALPAAVLFASPMQVREFYEENYQKLKEQASLLAQTSSGGSNKIFRNFSIHKNSLLLATDKFILKHLTGQNVVEPISKLPVKTLILCRLPFDQFTHPYQEALSKALPNAFEDYSLPRALYNFHSIMKFFYTPELRDIYVIDAKLAKPYARVFKDYWQNIPGAIVD